LALPGDFAPSFFLPLLGVAATVAAFLAEPGVAAAFATDFGVCAGRALGVPAGETGEASAAAGTLGDAEGAPAPGAEDRCGVAASLELPDFFLPALLGVADAVAFLAARSLIMTSRFVGFDASAMSRFS
jgi:hypothetical protein